MAIPAAPEVLTSNPDALVQTLTWAVAVLMLALLSICLAGAKTVKWLLNRCDKRTDAAWGKVSDLTGAINQTNSLEQDRQRRVQTHSGAPG